MTRPEREERRLTLRAGEKERAEIIQSGKLKDREGKKLTSLTPTEFYIHSASNGRTHNTEGT